MQTYGHSYGQKSVGAVSCLSEVQLCFWQTIPRRVSDWKGLRPISVGVEYMIFYLECYNDGTVKPSSDETEGGRNFFRCRQVPFNTGAWNVDPRDCRSSEVFRWKQGFLCPGSISNLFHRISHLGSLVSGLCFVQCILFQTRRFGNYKFSFLFFLPIPNSINSICITN